MLPFMHSTSDSSQAISVWQSKPWWCQPWSILLTGNGLIAGSGWLTQRVWVALLVGIPVLVWMGFFLVIYPQAWKKAMAEQIQKG
jgi:hypothetical protein